MSTRTASVRVRGGAPLRGIVALPADESIALRAIALAVLSEGETRIAPAPRGAAIDALVTALRALGAAIDSSDESLVVAGGGLHGLRMPTGALHAGTSTTTLALLTGLLAGQAFGTRVTYASARAACVQRIVDGLRSRGAHVAQASAGGALGGSSLGVAPLVDGEALEPIEHVLAAPDADAKTALLFSGLFTDATTAVAEPLLSADHTERWMSALGVPLRRYGSMTGLDPSDWDRTLRAPGDATLPRSTTLASCVAVLASAIEGSRVVMPAVGFNLTRTGVLDALRLGGGRFAARAEGEHAGQEPIARIDVEAGATRGGALGGELPLHAADAWPALVVLALRASRPVQLFDLDASAPELEALAQLARSFGIECHVAPGELRVSLRPTPRAARVSVAGDRDRGLLALLLALASEGESELRDMPVLDEQWPGLVGVLTELGAQLEVEAP